MHTWILVLMFTTGYGLSSTQIEYPTQKACEAAGKSHEGVNYIHPSVHYICIEK